MYVGKNPLCRTSVRSACAQGDGRVKFLNFAKFRNFTRTFHLSGKARQGFFDSLKRLFEPLCF